MKKFTIRDFISYGNVCINCNKRMRFRLERVDEDGDFSNVPISANGDKIDAKLIVNYASELVLRIHPKNNKFEVSDMNKFITYLGIKDLHVSNRCGVCQSCIISDVLQFDHKGFIRPITLLREIFEIHDMNNINDDSYKAYSILTEFKSDSTELWIRTRTGREEMVLPLLPLYKFKNKENLMKKIKTYIVFS